MVSNTLLRCYYLHLFFIQLSFIYAHYMFCIIYIYINTWEADGNRTSLNATKRTILMRFSHFFLNKCFPSCCKTLGDFQSSENVGSDWFCQRSRCFYRRVDFQKSSLCHCAKWSLGSQCFLSICIHCITHSCLAGGHRKTLSLLSQAVGYSFLYLIVFKQV